jgi:hypothetical protein
VAAGEKVNVRPVAGDGPESKLDLPPDLALVVLFMLPERTAERADPWTRRRVFGRA